MRPQSCAQRVYNYHTPRFSKFSMVKSIASVSMMKQVQRRWIPVERHWNVLSVDHWRPVKYAIMVKRAHSQASTKEFIVKGNVPMEVLLVCT